MMQPVTPTTRRRKAQSDGRVLPTYNIADGACSFRHTLTVRERTTLDRALEIVGRHLADRPVFDSPAAVKAYLQLHLAAESSEHFGVLFLDSQHRGIAFERMFKGWPIGRCR